MSLDDSTLEVQRSAGDQTWFHVRLIVRYFSTHQRWEIALLYYFASEQFRRRNIQNKPLAPHQQPAIKEVLGLSPLLFRRFLGSFSGLNEGSRINFPGPINLDERYRHRHCHHGQLQATVTDHGFFNGDFFSIG